MPGVRFGERRGASLMRGFLFGCLLGALAMSVVLTGASRAHNRPGTVHNREHAIVHAFCHSLKPCALGNKALVTFRCEAGPNLWPWARNGQYLGFAQMGDFARSYVASKGVPWSWGVWAQARAAAKLQSDLGWAQWECA